MDTVSIIIGLGFLAIFVLPFLFVRMANNKREKAFLERFLTLSKAKGATISESDLWNRNYAIGIDQQNKKLVYLQVIKEEEKVIDLDLSKVGSAKILRINKITANNDEVIDRLELVVETNVHCVLEFYNSESSNGLTDELKLIEKWMLKLTH